MKRSNSPSLVVHADAASIDTGGIAEKILDAVGRIKFGSVEVVIQNSKVVQIESREKVRILHDAQGQHSR